MKLIKLGLIALLSFLIACSDSSIVDPVNDSGSDEEYSLSKHGNKKPVKVKRTKKEIVIDGLKKDWKKAKKLKLKLEVDAGTPSPIVNKYDLRSEVRMLWDDENLYFFAKIRDEEIDASDGFPWERDGFEIYIDGDNSKNIGLEPVFPSPAYDGNDDFIRFIYGASDPEVVYGNIDSEMIEFEFMLTSKGYDLEIKIPFAAMSGFPLVDKKGHEFGVEFQTNDRDNGTRENFLKWKSALDESYFNPSLFGTAVLAK